MWLEPIVELHAAFHAARNRLRNAPTATAIAPGAASFVITNSPTVKRRDGFFGTRLETDMVCLSSHLPPIRCDGFQPVIRVVSRYSLVGRSGS